MRRTTFSRAPATVLALVLATASLIGASGARAQMGGMPGNPSAGQPSGDDEAKRAREREAAEEAAQRELDKQDEAEATAPRTEPGAAPAEPGAEYTPTESLPNRPKTLCQGRNIRQITVEGNLRVATEDLLATMRLRRGVPCADPDVTRDVNAIWDMGFFDDIVMLGEAVDDKDVALFVRVRERPAIGDIVYDGNDEVDDDDLDEKVSLEIGEILSVSEVKRQILKIRDKYAEEGFFLAKVKYTLEKMPNNEVRVHFVVAEGDEVSVRSLRFEGNENVPDSDIRDFMRTNQTGFFSFLSSNDTFNKDYFDEDMLRLQALYYDRGYLSVQVGTPRIALTADRKHIDISIPITEGPRFRIGRLQVEEVGADGSAVDPLGGRRKVRGMIDANPGEWFARADIAQGVMDITRHYRDRGFAKMRAVPLTRPDMAKNTVAVTIQIERGPPVTIERIDIRGNSRTRDKVIRREFRITEGELYNQTLVERSKARAMALGYFDRVDFSEEEGSRPDLLIINVDVGERATGQFNVGAGFSSIESFIFQGQIQQQNFLGLGHSLGLQLQLSGIRQLIQFQYVEPYLFDTEWTGIIEAFLTVRQFDTFTQERQGGALTFGHPVLHDNLRLYLRYKLENVDISSRTGGLFGSGGNSTGLNLLQRLPVANLFRSGITSSARLSLVWDSRDNRMFAQNGIYASVSTEVSDSYLGSVNVFHRNESFFRFYKQIWGPFVLRFNTEAGLVTSRLNSGVPLFERYFLGGIFNVRGYNLNSLGPRAGITRSSDPNALPSSTGVAIGGNFQFFYNLEVEFDIVKAIGIKGVVFTDAGNAWNLEPALGIPADGNDVTSDPRSSPSPFHLRHSWGLGIRWISPLGPLRFEWGFPFAPRAYEDSNRFDFTIGQFF